MLFAFLIGIVVSPVLTWAVDVSTAQWAFAWAMTTVALVAMVSGWPLDKNGLAFFALGIVISPTLTWGFDTSPWVWGTFWIVTAAGLFAAMEPEDEGEDTGGFAIGSAMVGFVVLAVVLLVVPLFTGAGSDASSYSPTYTPTSSASSSSSSSSGFTSSESRCIQYASRQYTAAYNKNDCAGTLGARNCVTLLTTIQWRWENGMDASKLERQYAAQC